MISPPDCLEDSIISLFSSTTTPNVPWCSLAARPWESFSSEAAQSSCQLLLCSFRCGTCLIQFVTQLGYFRTICGQGQCVLLLLLGHHQLDHSSSMYHQPFDLSHHELLYLHDTCSIDRWCSLFGSYLPCPWTGRHCLWGKPMKGVKEVSEGCGRVVIYSVYDKPQQGMHK